MGSPQASGPSEAGWSFTQWGQARVARRGSLSSVNASCHICARWIQAKFVNELFRVRELAERVAEKLKTAATGFIYQQIWRGLNVERWVDLAQEVPHDKPGHSAAKYFTWLCRREAATT
jgi:hypothetical protein